MHLLLNQSVLILAFHRSILLRLMKNVCDDVKVMRISQYMRILNMCFLHAVTNIYIMTHKAKLDLQRVALN